jgi:hypothetical protein
MRRNSLSFTVGGGWLLAGLFDGCKLPPFDEFVSNGKGGGEAENAL